MITARVKQFARRRRMAKLAMPPQNRDQFFRDAVTAFRLNPAARAVFIKNLCEARAFHEAQSHYAEHCSPIDLHLKIHELKKDLMAWCMAMDLADCSTCTKEVATDEERMRDALLEIDRRLKWCRENNYKTSPEYLAKSLGAAQSVVDSVRDTFRSSVDEPS